MLATNSSIVEIQRSRSYSNSWQNLEIEMNLLERISNSSCSSPSTESKTKRPKRNDMKRNKCLLNFHIEIIKQVEKVSSIYIESQSLFRGILVKTIEKP